MSGRRESREALMRHFNMEELATMCFDLGIDDETLSRETKGAFVRDLITHFEAKARLAQLIAECKRLRPEVDFVDPGAADNFRQEMRIPAGEGATDITASYHYRAYSDVWNSLQALRFAGDDLWEEQTEATITGFLTQWEATRALVANSASCFEEADWNGLLEVLKAFSKFKIGKRKVYEILQRERPDEVERAAAEAVTSARRDLERQLRANRKHKQEYEELLGTIGKSFRTRLLAPQ
jgi:hypothetical protein